MSRPSFRFAGVLTALMLLATLWVAWSRHLPVRDHDGLAGPSWLQVPVIAILAIVVDVAPRALRRGWRAPSRLHAVAREVFRERWPASFVRFALAGLLVSYLVNSSFRNLKSWVPFVNSRLWDRTLDRMDQQVWLGNEPATVLHDLLGTGWAAHVLSVVYVSWLVLVPFTLGIALLWSRRTDASAWFVTALSVDWALGLVAYYLVPSIGPVYAHPERFTDLPDTYVTHLQQSMLADRGELLSDPFSAGAVEPIAAFASLHVALVVTMVLMAHLLGTSRWVVVAGWLYLALTVVATIYLGWHYFVDDLGGAAIGAGAVWIAAWGTGQSVHGRAPAAVPVTAQPVSPRLSRSA